MFNKKKFNEAVLKSGYRRRYIADEMHIGYSNFKKRCQGVVDWKGPEIAALKRILNLDGDDVMDIFFDEDLTSGQVDS